MCWALCSSSQHLPWSHKEYLPVLIWLFLQVCHSLVNRNVKNDKRGSGELYLKASNQAKHEGINVQIE